MTKHPKSYIICSTSRSGSTLLCDLLTDSGVAGRPNSFFMPEFYREWAREFNISTDTWDSEHEFDQSYLSAVLKYGADKTNVFGMRLMWKSFAELSKRLGTFFPDEDSDSARFRSAFETPCYIYLSRENKVAQAVSTLKAVQTGLWHIHADGTERERLKPKQDAVYDERALSQQVAECEKHDAAWVDWFSQQNIEPVCITYESLSKNPQATLEVILSVLGLDPTIAQTIAPNTSILSDSESRNWVARFEAKKS
jgi:LPS sulfotransferase NodH